MYLARRLQILVRDALEDGLAPLGVTVSQYMALSMLGRRDGLSSAQLARRFGIEPQSVTSVIKSLETRRLISRRETDANRRILSITLTKTGRSCLAACDAMVDRAEEGLFANLGQAELATLRQLLQKVLEHTARREINHAHEQPKRSRSARR
jgi:DNA-binding MarR family transcriptional regulator